MLVVPVPVPVAVAVDVAKSQKFTRLNPEKFPIQSLGTSC